MHFLIDVVSIHCAYFIMFLGIYAMKVVFLYTNILENAFTKLLGENA